MDSVFQNEIAYDEFHQIRPFMMKEAYMTIFQLLLKLLKNFFLILSQGLLADLHYILLK